MDMNNMGGSGLDFANLIGTMMKNNNGEDGWTGNNTWLWFILIWLIWGRGNMGFGNGEAAQTAITTEAMEAAINKSRANELSDQVVLEAVNGNRTAISEIMTTLNCDYNQLQTALGQLNTSLQQISNQVGLTSQQIINAIQLGNQNLGQQLMQCCCDTKTAMSNGFGDLRTLITEKSNAAIIQNMQQTTQLQGVTEAGFALMGNRFNDQAMATQKGFQEIKDMLNQSKIDSLQEKVTQLQNSASNSAQTAYLQNYVAGAIAPLQTTVNELYNRSVPRAVPSYPAPEYANGYAYHVVPTCACGCNTTGI